MRPKLSVLLIVGHSPRSPGARNLGPTMEPGDDTYEFGFNEPIVRQVGKGLNSHEVEAKVDYYRPSGGNVARWNGASDLLVEFHCNAFNRQATGTEVLFAKGSERGRDAANIMRGCLLACLGLDDRGEKPKVKSDRGGYLLWGVSQVALIPEPFFIDNDADLARARDVDLADAYVAAIAEIINFVI